MPSARRIVGHSMSRELDERASLISATFRSSPGGKDVPPAWARRRGRLGGTPEGLPCPTYAGRADRQQISTSWIDNMPLSRWADVADFRKFSFPNALLARASRRAASGATLIRVVSHQA